MAGRFSVEGVFRVIDRMTRPIRRMERSVGRFNQRMTRGVQRLASNARALGPAFAAAGVAITAMAAAAVAALHDVIETGIDFDQTMARARGRFQLSATSEEFAALREAAMRAGSSTEFSSSQAAEALAALGAAGFNARQAVAALPGVVDLATAGQLELGDATSRAADTLGQWGLMTDDAAQLSSNLERANNVLARAANSANLSLEDVSDAFRDAAPAARDAGISLEQTSAMIDVLAASGIRGSQAGTAFRGVLQALTAPTTRARGAFRRLHVNLEDGHGNVRDMTDILGDLQGAMSGLGTAQRSRALTDIFGRQRATPGSVLINGAEAAREYQAALENADGAASTMAETMRDTAGGDMASLTSTIEGFKLQIWETVRGPMRGITRGMTEWVRANQGWISSGFQAAMQWVRDNSPAIEAWVRRIAIAFVVLAAIALFFAVVIAVVMVVVIGVLIAIAAGVVWLVEMIIETGSAVAAAVWGALQGMWAQIVAFFTAAHEFVVGLFVVIGRAAAPYLAPVIAAFRAVAAWVRQAWAPIGTFLSAIWARIVSTAQADFNRLMGIVNRVVAGVRAAWAPIGAFFTDLWNGIAAGFNDTVGGVIDAVSGFINSTRAEGRGELARSEGRGASPQVVTSSERVARSVSESTNRQEVDIRIVDDGGNAEVQERRPSRGSPVRVSRSGTL